MTVAHDEEALHGRLDELAALHALERISPYASPELLTVLQGFIAESGVRRITTVRRAVPS